MGRSGRRVSFRRLDEESRALAELLAANGLRSRDHLAILMDNTARYFPVAWAAQRSGLFFTPVNWHLTAAEARYIVEDCGARALVASGALADLAAQVAAGNDGLALRLIADGAAPGFADYDAALGGVSGDPRAARAEAIEGSYMFYSSGTTGRPKGIKPELALAPYGTGNALDALLHDGFGFDTDTVYLCPGPLYHAAPLGWSMSTQRNGGTVVVMERFDAEEALRLIETHRVTHLQCVPTMFVRMLKLPAAVRERYDLSSLRVVVHAAAPCPVPVKEQMIDWLGPIIHEYYAGSESNGFVRIDSVEWLRHKGSVGTPALGTVHILDERGVDLPPGEVGTIYFEGTRRFEYFNDPAKTAGAFNDKGWSTLGDLGSLDAEGYLYIADRRSDLIITGGVNVYPQEVEEAIVVHPAVYDVAVVGLPDDEMGQRIAAVVQPARGAVAGPELAAELLAHCRRRLAGFKCPRTLYFDDALPRLPSGKLLRREVRDRYANAEPGHPAPGYPESGAPESSAR